MRSGEGGEGEHGHTLTNTQTLVCCVWDSQTHSRQQVRTSLQNKRPLAAMWCSLAADKAALPHLSQARSLHVLTRLHNSGLRARAAMWCSLAAEEAASPSGVLTSRHLALDSTE